MSRLTSNMATDTSLSYCECLTYIGRLNTRKGKIKKTKTQGTPANSARSTHFHHFQITSSSFPSSMRWLILPGKMARVTPTQQRRGGLRTEKREANVMKNAGYLCVHLLRKGLMYPGWPQIYYTAKAGLWMSPPPALNSQVLALQVCTTAYSVFKKEGTSERRRRSQAWQLMPLKTHLGDRERILSQLRSTE